MALSNWDHAAWDKFGDSRRGELTFPGNIRVEIYKDWVYVYDPNMKGSFIQVDKDGVDVSYDSRDETIVHMSEGKLSYKNIDILVFCDDEHGTFIHAKYDHRYEGYQYIECDPIILCGIGKYGFCGNEWVGITDSDVKAFAEWLVKIDSPLKELADARPYNQGDAFFCGVDNAMKRYNTASETVLMSGLKSAFKDRNKKKR